MRSYKNPVYGVKGVFGGDAPAFLTKEELIELASEDAIGVSKGIESAFDSFLDWMSEASGESIDFRYEDLSLEELGVVDSIVFYCANCGWTYSTSEKNDYEDECYCNDCYNDILEEEDN